jgi:hypothetical protein
VLWCRCTPVVYGNFELRCRHSSAIPRLYRSIAWYVNNVQSASNDFSNVDTTTGEVVILQDDDSALPLPTLSTCCSMTTSPVVGTMLEKSLLVNCILLIYVMQKRAVWCVGHVAISVIVLPVVCIPKRSWCAV